MSFIIPVLGVLAFRMLSRRAAAAEAAAAAAREQANKERERAGHEHDRGKHAAELARDERKRREALQRELDAAERAKARDKPAKGKGKPAKPYDPEQGDTTDNVPPPAAPFDVIDEALGQGDKAGKAKASAVKLRDYLRANRTAAAYGYKGHPSAAVAVFQRAAGEKPDGFMGPDTFAAGRRLGVTFPPRPSAEELSSHHAPTADDKAKAAKAAHDKAVADNVAHNRAAKAAAAKAKAAKDAGDKAAHAKAAAEQAAHDKAAKAAADKAKAAKAAHAKAAAEKAAADKAKARRPAAKGRSAEQAASDLLAYAQRSASLPVAQRASAFGYKGHPNAFVSAAQRDMGLADADGIYGPATRARGQQLTGKSFPTR